MNLEKLYDRVFDAISSLDYESIWQGFQPLKFALYDDENCFFDGAYIEKSDDFCANTSILYRGEQIAIWSVADEPDIPVLASKIVHEMFHGYQTLQHWDCFANETEALCRYRYCEGNLTLRLRENELLLRMLNHFDEAAYHEFLSHRKLRSEKYPYEYSYESKVEEIEGTATYVEWMVLKQLDRQAAAVMEERMRAAMTNSESLFPIRISAYNTGALIVNALIAAGAYSFTATKHPFVDTILKHVRSSDKDLREKEVCDRKVSDAITSFDRESERIIQTALKANKVVLSGPLELLCVNIYDARYYKGYITSRYFLLYREGNDEKMIQGNFVIEMADEKTISCVYRWEDLA